MKKVSQADLIAAEALGKRLQDARSLARAPESAVLMKDANDFHALVSAATKDTRDLLGALRVCGVEGGEVKNEEILVSRADFDALQAYLDRLEELQARASVVYGRALAHHVGREPEKQLEKIGEHMTKLEERLVELLAPKIEPPTSSVIEIAK